VRNINNPTRILVVDDDKNVRKTMNIILTKKGYAVDLAASGNEAINRAKETVYKVAIIDIRLPDMEGVELLTKMRETVPKTRKIMITGYPTMQNAVTALNSKADAYLIKPVDIKKLLGIIQEQIQLQNEEMKFSQQKVSDYIESRVREN
jgi:two-component system NtrC family response regulator